MRRLGEEFGSCVSLKVERTIEVSCLLIEGRFEKSSLVMLLLASTLLIIVKLVVPRDKAAEDFL